ncbi:MAG: hypothetical protein HYZ49_12970 [Chloroflexi bacterium]|nr:hypothetical protein [Chloroflexota bacterium]
MTRKTLFFGLVLSALTLGVAACSAAQAPAAATPAPSAQTNIEPTAPPTPSEVEQSLARFDSQGAVEFVVTPLNLTTPNETLDFDISLNTHSVDLSWDLAAQSVLTTDTGLEVKGLNWPVGGGHHYEGTLTFPTKTADGKFLLDGAKTLTLTIQDAGVASRMFEWELSQ